MENQPRSQRSKEDISEWLTEHGDLLFRYALRRVGETDTAEDLVQDTFLAALGSVAGFQGRSKVQTWLVGILRNKIADYLRKVSRQREREVQDQEGIADAGIFQNGHWRIRLKRWPADPAEWTENQEFWKAVGECQSKLPVKLALAFRMRELEDLSMVEICETLEITTTNLSVRLHRARILLRDCLERSWFAAGRES